VAQMKMGTGVGSQEVDQSYFFSFWREEYVRALQWENLWKPDNYLMLKYYSLIFFTEYNWTKSMKLIWSE
jgi:hypothetical protein